MEYQEFLKKKVRLATESGFIVNDSDINPALKPHNKLMVKWMVKGARRACFASFGLHKTVTQLEVLRCVLLHTGGRGLIICPLGVRQEFIRDAKKILGWETPPKFIRNISEAGAEGIYITNYETVRDGKLDPRLFQAVSLDEASILRGLGGSKTFREFMRLFTGDAGPKGDRRGVECVPYRFVATATPSPNDYIELLAYADFLGVMDVSQAKTRFFKRDSTKADKLTIHAHKEEEFWLWVSSWALFVSKPSDLTGNEEDDMDYNMPEIDIRWHEIPSDHSNAGVDYNGQYKLIKDDAIGLQGASKEKRESIDARVAKIMEIREEDLSAHRLIWHDQDKERDAIKKAIPSIRILTGSQDEETKEKTIIGFSDGEFQELAAKAVMAGSGCNFQYHCHWAIYAGIGFKFNDFIQSIHRILRFQQKHRVRIDLIHTEAERQIRKRLEEKWNNHNKQVKVMTDIIKKYGLSVSAMAEILTRKIGVERVEVQGRNYTAVNNDNVLESARMEENSVGLILTSIPFGNQYEYSPNYADFGHSENKEEFWRQMDYLTPNLHRCLMPGRLMCVHVKDRITPSGLTGRGYQTVDHLHIDAVLHYEKHGFGYMGMKTIVTDVVRENNQTYRLGWTEQCKDGSKMGVGMPEYLLIFRKDPSDTSNAYADVPVIKAKPFQRKKDGTTQPYSKDDYSSTEIVPGSGYSRSRWQIDAHGFTRSSGDRLMDPKELAAMDHSTIFQTFKDHSLKDVYNFEHHVKIAEDLEVMGKLPSGFMLLQPQSWSDEVWTDITRMLTLNGSQWSMGKEMHICLARNSMVLTRGGFKPIQDCEVGDEALTHKGRWRKILKVKNTGVQKVIKLKAHGVPGLTITPDHKIWTRFVKNTAWAKCHSRKEAAGKEPEWIEAKDTLGSYINSKLPPIEKPNNEDLLHWWVVGRWLADGHFDSRGGVVISCGDHEVEFLQRKLGGYGGNPFHGTGTAKQILIKDKDKTLRDTLSRCGSYAYSKHIPPEAYTLPVDQAYALLNGYLSGDGHFVPSRNSWNASSVSKELLMGMSLLVQRVYGSIASIYPGRSAGADEIQGRKVKTKQEWILCFDVPSSDRPKGQPFILDDGAWKKVRSLELVDEPEETWCLKVEEDESFYAEGCIVKNCPMQFDIADRVIEQMSNPGDVVYDPFAGLMTVPLRAMLKGRYGKGHELSPQYFLDGVAHLKAAEHKISIPTLFDLVNEAV